jgi:hypothetical protein
MQTFTLLHIFDWGHGLACLWILLIYFWFRKCEDEIYKSSQGSLWYTCILWSNNYCYNSIGIVLLLELYYCNSYCWNFLNRSSKHMQTFTLLHIFDWGHGLACLQILLIYFWFRKCGDEIYKSSQGSLWYTHILWSNNYCYNSTGIVLLLNSTTVIATAGTFWIVAVSTCKHLHCYMFWTGHGLACLQIWLIYFWFRKCEDEIL